MAYAERAKENKRKQQQKKRKRKRNKLKGLCSQCENKSLPDVVVCLTHWLKQKSLKTFKTSTKWKDLWRLLKEQNYKCSYTGKVLIPGKNASIEHKVPKSKGGTNNLSNLHWVDFYANSLKNNMNENEFLEYIKIIYEHNNSK